ncbi:anti-CBASS protein Acb1 family protein [Lactobacillus apis]|uniref:anti-CBASS protein Acb1 family protein n=1 Tax=Lactobacillus apis TaxID=303541 RepID=UPI002431FE94|nr:anti-CBASS Acb1 family protein [Lactobacillus apis]
MALNLDWLKKEKHSDKKAIRSDSMDFSASLPYDHLNWQYTIENKNYKLFNNRYKNDAIARRIVAKPAEDATRNGFRLVIPDDPEKQDKYQDALDKLRLGDALTKQLIYQRLHGDGYITFGIEETGNGDADLQKPVKNDCIRDVTFVHAFGQTHISQSVYNDDPTDKNYQKEKSIKIRPTNSAFNFDENGNPDFKPEKNRDIIIDKSRYFHISLDKLEDDPTGTSVLTRCAEQLKAMNIALETAGKILREYSIKVFNSANLKDVDDDKFYELVSAFSDAMNTESVAVIGPDDKLTKLSTPTNGIDTLLDFVWQTLSAACNIPKSVLTGEQAGSLAGASQDVINYYDSVKATQETLLKPEIEYIVRLLMYASDVGDGSEDPDGFEWHVEFNPLWSPDDKTQSDTLLNHANAASTLVGAGIYDADEARQMLDGQGNNAIQGMQSTTKKDSSDKPTPEQIKQYLDDIKKANYGKKA